MVYHIYKHRIVLPTWCFGFANKQIPFSEKARAVPERRAQSSPGRDPFVCFLPNLPQSRILCSVGTFSSHLISPAGRRVSRGRGWLLPMFP